ncbi:winged helix-turn-helix transcriptional regulator [Streptomyces prasinopilosus]|uniref:winged helix-turn-helix transcriptional regulator n=1 Tax=Streptomyces prasinopilosus TaxID=67344 RepID=UPI001FD1CF66|nr:winged helix-turn-helix transcriptional regulator [Streptomyces prasinopilosus]
MDTVDAPAAGRASRPGPSYEDSRYCPKFHSAVELIGRRWNGAILLAIIRGADRYKDVLDAVPGLSERLLAQRLKELEQARIIERDVIPSTPVRITYHLTPRGIELAEAIEPLLAWGDRWIDLDSEDPA